MEKKNLTRYSVRGREKSKKDSPQIPQNKKDRVGPAKKYKCLGDFVMSSINVFHL